MRYETVSRQASLLSCVGQSRNAVRSEPANRPSRCVQTDSRSSDCQQRALCGRQSREPSRTSRRLTSRRLEWPQLPNARTAVCRDAGGAHGNRVCTVSCNGCGAPPYNQISGPVLARIRKILSVFPNLATASLNDPHLCGQALAGCRRLNRFWRNNQQFPAYVLIVDACC